MSNNLATLLTWEKEKRLIEAGGFVPFCNAFGYQLARHHLLLAEKLERTISEPGYNVIICMPPGHAKSTYASILFPAYFLSLKNKSVITASHTAELATKWGRRCKRIIEDPKYRYIFNTELRKDSKATDRFELVNGSEYFACGMLAGVAGQRADLTILDDPVKSIEEADSETLRNKIWDTFISEYKTRAKPGMSMIAMMTRRHEDDLIGRILNSPEKNKWDVLILPALAEGNDPMGRAEGDALWPEQFPSDTLLEIRDGLNSRDIRFWNSLYQQRPTVEQGYYFKREWIQTINRLPPKLNVYGASDYAVTDGGGDYTVHVITGHDPKTDDIYIMDVWRQQAESNVWVESFIDLVARYKPLMWAEESGQILKSLNPFIEKEMKRRGKYVYREQYTSTTDKCARARSFQAYMAQGRVFILNDTWTPALKSELLSFPDGMHDDQVDALGLVGRMLDEMRMRIVQKRKNRQDDYRSNKILLPGLDEKISNTGKYKRI